MAGKGGKGSTSDSSGDGGVSVVGLVDCAPTLSPFIFSKGPGNPGSPGKPSPVSPVTGTAAPVVSPAAAPAVSPVDVTISEACVELASGEKMTSGNSEPMNFDYEIETVSGADINEILASVEDSIVDFVTPALLGCDVSGSTSNVIGAEGLPVDTVDNESACVSGTSDSGNTCWPINGKMTQYLNANATRFLKEEDATEEPAALSEEVSNALSVLQKAMEDGSINDAHPDIVRMTFIGARGTGETVESPGAIEQDTSDGSEDTVSGLGAGIIAISALLVGAVALLAVRKYRKNQLDKKYDDMENKDVEEFDEGYDDGTREMDFATVSVGDAVETSNKQRMAHVVGEADSVYDGGQGMYGSPGHGPYGATQSESPDSQSSYIPPSASALNRQHSTVNVHKCTSATCEICAQRRNEPRFLSTALTSSSFGSKTPSPSGTSQSSPSRSVSTSGAKLMRPYPTEDTVVL